MPCRTLNRINAAAPGATAIRLNAGKVSDIYDVVSGQFLRTAVTGQTSIKIAANDSVVIVIAPAGGVYKKENGKVMINDIVVNYHAN